MEGQVSWITEATVKEDSLGALEELMEEMVEGTSAEPGALVYEWFVSADRTSFHLVETYASSDAALAHLGSFREKWAVRFVSCIEITRFTVYGDPSSEVRAIFDRSGAMYLGPRGGFSRFS